MLYVWLVFVFVTGAAVGSFLNVCVARLPFEKSLLWPGSRCGACFQPVPWYDNVPLLSYWLLRGRCRRCGQRFGMSYFFVELCTGLAFVGLFYLEIVLNALDLPLLQAHQAEIVRGELVGVPVESWQVGAWIVFGWHALLLSFLIVTSLCDWQYLEVPLGVTVCGTLVGLVGSAFLAWPFPATDAVVAVVHPRPAALLFADEPPPAGLYPWPVWLPEQLPSWMTQGSWQLGLATGLAGALAGMVMLRGVRFLFGLGRGKEGLGIGDADLMMMAGSFVGWQPILVAFFVGVFAALFFGVAQLMRKGDHPLPFAPPLAAGVVVSLLAWPVLGRIVYPLFSVPLILGGLVAAGAVFLLVASFLLRLVRGTDSEPAAEAEKKKEA
jgi:leader peptidase (prepilin peptidase)/N-methyltransferase